MSPKAPAVQVIVVAIDPAGNQVAFVASGWKAAHTLKQAIESWNNKPYGWKYEGMMRLVSQREVRS